MLQKKTSKLYLSIVVAGFLAGSFLSASAAFSDQAFLGGSVKAIAAQPTSDPNEAYVTRSVLTSNEKSATVNFEVALKMRNYDDLEARLAKGQRISAQEMAATYEPTAADYQQVEAWLSAQGLKITHESQHHLAVFVSGSVTQVQKAMSVTFGRVSFQNQEYTSAITAPSVPAWMSSKLIGVNGLQPQFRPRKHIVFAPDTTASFGGLIYSPQQIASAYDAVPLYHANLTGSGQTIAIIIDTFPYTSDLALFWKTVGVNQSLSNIQFIQVVPGTLAAPEGEETLDTEWSSGMAPNAKVRVYATLDLSSSNLDLGYNALLDDVTTHPEYNIHQMSMSYGIAESLTSLGQASTDDAYFASLTAAGVTCFASSGDSGSTPGPDNLANGPLGVNSPADSPNVTSVGGTSLVYDSTTNSVNNETVWNRQSPSIGVAASGGGISSFFDRPAWQTGNGVDPMAERQVPDVAASADEFRAATVFLQGKSFRIGGTSWSSPTWAGLCALMNEARETAGLSDLGLLGPLIYPLIGTTCFRDITVGDNATPTSDKKWPATIGYDKATGIGAPLINALTQQLISSSTLVGITPSAATVQVQPGQAATFTVGVSGGTATYQWQEEDLGSATWNNLTDGSPYSGTATSTLTVNPTTTAMSGEEFRCVVTITTPVNTAPSTLIVDTPLMISTIAGVAATPGYVNGANKSEFKSPVGVGVDGAGNVYVADSGNNAIRMITPAGVVSTPYGSTKGIAGFAEGAGNIATFNDPRGVTVDPSGNIYVADRGNGVVRKISNGIVTQFGNTQLVAPSVITSDSSGNVYVAESYGRIFEVSPSAVYTSIASGLNEPTGIAVDSSGNVYVTEGGNFDVVKISGGVTSVFAGQTGSQGYQDGVASSALFNAPAGVCVDDANNVYVTDSLPAVAGTRGVTYGNGNNVIRKISPTGVVSTVAGSIGTAGSANGFGTAAQFNGVQGITFGGAGNFYMADTSSNTIRQGSLTNKIGAVVTLSNLSVPYTGSPQAVTVTTTPASLPVSISYKGSPVAPTFAGTYPVVVTVNDVTYSGSATGTLMIGTAPTIPPTVATGSASTITGTSAVVSETVNPEGSSTSGYFQYGTTTGYGSTSTTTVIGSGTANTVSSNTITFPSSPAAVTYHYRAVASNQAGIVYGADKTFTALAAPTLTTGATPFLTATGAEVAAAVNPHGVSTSVYIQYGTTTAYGSVTGFQNLGSGTSPVNVFLVFPSLNPNTTYDYQLVMVSAAGTFYGPPQTFTTLGFDTVLVANSGAAAPGTGSTFASFGPPAVNDLDGVAFNATLSLGGGVTSSSNIGIWADDTGGTLDLIVQTGSTAPGTGGLFQTLSDPVYNNPASVAFVGTTSTRATGIWTNDSGSLALVAQVGGAAAGTPGTFASFGPLGLTDSAGPVFYATLKSGGGITSSNNAGIWEGDTAQTLALQLGQTISGKTITSLTFMPSLQYVGGQSRSYNSIGDLACLATFTDRTTGFVEDIGGTPEVLTYSGLPADGVSGATYASFGNPAINDDDFLAYQATISGTGITRSNNTGIWADDGLGDRVLVAQTGTGAAPGTTALFTGFSDPVININEAVAFRGVLNVASGQATNFNNLGIWATGSNLASLSLVARQGSQAPGCPTGATFASFVSLGLPDQGGAVFLATLNPGAGGVTTTNNTGIWAVDDTGTLQLIVRTGDVLLGKTITSMVFLSSPAYVTGSTRSFTAPTGDLTYLVTFSDKSTAIFGVVFP